MQWEQRKVKVKALQDAGQHFAAIKEAVEEMVNDNYEVRVSKLNATDREPWDQYAFDICEKIRG